ncbi:hypothetical protein D187_009424 [Cystobacter fuscus DSM 2262]|uniref:Next to BRCA1 central domain-containing protein n=1 Tax=Cystobacter fuscus (strain ATCC 25194 / DSM 2262 / NBRC 100088 / M29) TaxID=1242864 RepID=S9NYX3_CYSF2|nr:NBR1-Ig-like domain-containing protein [Cystobacter fuscus]EPX55217.1 hypothetical protein D187_009424 [Cystobacter fuscus DSM 2262]
MKLPIAPFLLLASLCLAAPPAFAGDSAVFVSQTVPTSLTTGEVRTVSVTLRNNGTTTWTRSGELGYKLGSQNPQDNSRWIYNRIYLNDGESISPGHSKTFTFNITAPPTPGTYNFQWRMLQENVAWFGDFSPNVTIQVAAPVPHNAQFVTQSVPATLVAGQSASVSVTMKNIGTNVWTAAAGYRLGSRNPQDNLTWGIGRVDLAPQESIRPNEQKTFTFNITAPSVPGTYNFQWRMLQEDYIWFGDSSPNVAYPLPVTLCPGVSVVPDGMSDLGPSLQTCINNLPSGGTLELPPGAYGMGTQVLINKPFTLRTRGLENSAANCEEPGINCAVLKALPSFNAKVGGFLAAEATQNVTFDHLILDGNRAARLGTTAASQCPMGSDNNRWGFNARMSDCAFCRFTHGVSKNALCGTALEFRGNDGTITNSVFRSNGQNSVPGMWADGLTIHFSDRATVTHNTFVDNSDVALILGGGQNAVVTHNRISQPGQVAFAGLMLDNFNTPAWGNFTGAVVSGNTIDCSAARNCHFGIEIGPHPWYLPPTNIQGGDVHGNSVSSARQGINVDGAGTTQAPLLLYGNTVTNEAPGSASFNCGVHSTSRLNINTADSVVDRNGDTTPMTTFEWHLCP